MKCHLEGTIEIHKKYTMSDPLLIQKVKDKYGKKKEIE